MAVNLGLADPRLLDSQPDNMLPIERGLENFSRHLGRPSVAGGPKESTKKRYRRIIRAFREFAGGNRLHYWEQINADIFNRFARQRGTAYTHSSVVTEIVLLKAIHRYLIEERHLDSKYAFAYRVRRPTQSTKYCPTADETRAILAHLTRKPGLKWLLNAAAILSHTGMRFGEMAQLTWDDVDLKVGFVHVRDEFGKGDKTTKTGYSRVLPIHPAVREVIEGLSRHSDNRLFHGPRGGRLRSETFGNHLRKFALRPLAAQFPHPRFQKITAHSFRHFFASCCAAAGIAQQTTMDWMGHRTNAMAKYYFHRDDQAEFGIHPESNLRQRPNAKSPRDHRACFGKGPWH